MPTIHTIPREVEKAFGAEGTEKFVLFLNQAFEDQKKDVIETVSREFHSHVTSEVGTVRLEVANLRTEMADLRTEVKTDIAELRADMAELRTEVKTDIAELGTEMANLRAEFKSDISEVHKAISIQTRWILVALLGGAILYPISMKLIDRLFAPPAPSVQIQTPK